MIIGIRQQATGIRRRVGAANRHWIAMVDVKHVDDVGVKYCNAAKICATYTVIVSRITLWG